MNNQHLTSSDSRALRSIVSENEMIAALNYAVTRNLNVYGAKYDYNEPGSLRRLEDISFRIKLNLLTIFDIGAVLTCLIYQYSIDHPKVLKLSSYLDTLHYKHNIKIFFHGLLEMKSMRHYHNLVNSAFLSNDEVFDPMIAA
jgi:hypothetical protein